MLLPLPVFYFSTNHENGSNNFQGHASSIAVCVCIFYGKKAQNSSIFVCANGEKKSEQQNVLYNLLLVVRQLEIWWVWTGFAWVAFGCVKNQHLMTVPLKRWRWQFVPMKDESAPCGRTNIHGIPSLKRECKSSSNIPFWHVHTHTQTNHIQIDCQNNKRPTFLGLLFNISMHTWDYFCFAFRIVLARSHWPSSIPICYTFSSSIFPATRIHFDVEPIWLKRSRT